MAVYVPLCYGFNPTDSELACHYLSYKVMGFPLSCPHIVQDYDLYGQEEPWQVWDKFGGSNNDEDDDGAGPSTLDLFFFTTLKKINPKSRSSNFERAVCSDGGSWHGHHLRTFHSNGITWNRRRYCYKNPNIEKKNKKNCGRKRKSVQSNPQTKPVKRQLKKLKSESRTEETVQVTAPPTHVPVHVPLSENLLYALDDSCFNEKQKIAIDSLASLMKAMEAIKTSNTDDLFAFFLFSMKDSTCVGKARASTLPKYHNEASTCGAHSHTCDIMFREDVGINALLSVLSGFLYDGSATSSFLLQTTNFHGGNFDFKDCNVIVPYLQEGDLRVKIAQMRSSRARKLLQKKEEQRAADKAAGIYLHSDYSDDDKVTHDDKGVFAVYPNDSEARKHLLKHCLVDKFEKENDCFMDRVGWERILLCIEIGGVSKLVVFVKLGVNGITWWRKPVQLVRLS
ncbi:unnamed protein product [Dovyalis caffra]|uniref:NAC domain-containing protein n=1 Tax=Dovyalis caffra TaxID=77055 RepID=A0AAV1RWF3_9ROSI|nr:unnamed protein product [Dovyalis caffra]